ncbi:hypothetical protein BIFBIF_00086 [Bifidobacterium bifidum ATCC 29521 = JCM 1255 = DSM 20456]|nr:hypothetical protein BIFBIF_00086 [Bifidobacterium bifidum ATCC 29521 = JCM 1255 = DSM 20456]
MFHLAKSALQRKQHPSYRLEPKLREIAGALQLNVQSQYF